jgi:hypothetical protein
VIADVVEDFTTVNDGLGVVVTVALDGAEFATGPVGGVPCATAVSVIDPLLKSACVLVYVAVQVVVAFGASVVTGQKIGLSDAPTDGAVWVSVTFTVLNVTLPVFVTRNEYATVAPTVDTVVGLADFTTVIAGLCAAVTVAVEGVEAIPAPVGGVPIAVAESASDPLSRSAWVTVYVAVHVVAAAGASVVARQVIGDKPVASDGADWVSATVTPVSVTLPVFFTANE